MMQPASPVVADHGGDNEDDLTILQMLKANRGFQMKKLENLESDIKKKVSTSFRVSFI